MEVHNVLRLPRNLHMEVHKVLRLPCNLHIEVHKGLRLPRNLRMAVHKVLRRPRTLRMEVRRVLHLPRTLRMGVRTVLRVGGSMFRVEVKDGGEVCVSFNVATCLQGTSPGHFPWELFSDALLLQRWGMFGVYERVTP